MGKYFEKTAISQTYVTKGFRGARKKLNLYMSHADRLTIKAGPKPSKHVQKEIDAATELVASTGAKIIDSEGRIKARFARRLNPAVKIPRTDPAAEKATSVYYKLRAQGKLPSASA